MNAKQNNITLILAAGLSTRFGYSKALIKIQENTLVERLVRMYSQCSEKVFVVTGFEAETVSQVLNSSGAEIVFNADYKHGVLTSLLCGLSQITKSSETIEGVIISPVDLPLDDIDVPLQLIQEGRKNHALIAIPTFKSINGYPIWASIEAVKIILTPSSQLSKYEKEIKSLLMTIPQPGVSLFSPPEYAKKWIKYIPMDNSDILANFNTPDSYLKWLKLKQLEVLS